MSNVGGKNQIAKYKYRQWPIATKKRTGHLVGSLFSYFTSVWY